VHLPRPRAGRHEGQLQDHLIESQGETERAPHHGPGRPEAEDRTQPPAARELIGRYDEEQLGLLLEHVREGFAQLDGVEIDAFDLDELIHRYQRSARELWTFAGKTARAGCPRPGRSDT
jgi:hypothetical protein